MERTSINPWTWSLDLGFNQAELVVGHTRELILAGQSAMSPEGLPNTQATWPAKSRFRWTTWRRYSRKRKWPWRMSCA